MSEQSPEGKSETTDRDSSGDDPAADGRITDDMLPEDLQPTDDNPLAKPPSDEDAVQLSTFAGQAALALERARAQDERQQLAVLEDRERIAYHESGHAILGLVVAGADPVNRVTIVPRGRALGVTYQRPDADRYNYPEAYLRARIIGMLGGRAAEEVVYGTRTTGAENDIEQATNLARSMVTRWGMSDKLGMVQLAPRQNPYLGASTAFGAATSPSARKPPGSSTRRS